MMGTNDRMSLGDPTPDIIFVYKEGEERMVSNSWTGLCGIRNSKGERPIKVKVLGDISDKAVYKWLYPALAVHNEGIEFVDDTKIIKGKQDVVVR